MLFNNFKIKRIFLFILYVNFLLFLFNVYLSIKNSFILFDSINLNKFEITPYLNSQNNSTFSHYIKLKFKFNNNYVLKRNFNTSINIKAQLDSEENNYNFTNYTDNSNFKNLDIKNFKQKYNGGYLGYKNIQSFGDVSYLSLLGTSAEASQEIYYYSKDLESKLNHYLKGIPENITYTLLAVLKTKDKNGEYKTITISKKAIKITRNTSRNLLASKLIQDTMNAVFIYDFIGSEMDLYLLDRPWLSENDFNSDLSKVTKILDNQIEQEIFSFSKLYELNNFDKVNKIKNYKYKNNFMDNYGSHIYDKNNNLIGYKINEFEYASVITYYNENGLLCNKISIKDFNTEDLCFEDETLITWTDTRTAAETSGFIRELDNNVYYYDKNNNLINVEVKYNQPKFPFYKLDTNLNDKIGTIDFETFGDNLGFGSHRVYAGGWSIKNYTKLFYINPRQTSEQFVQKIFKSIFMNDILNGYTFYIHNLGRFDSIFIMQSLILNSNILITPIWKENSILSINLKYNDF